MNGPQTAAKHVGRFAKSSELTNAQTNGQAAKASSAKQTRTQTHKVPTVCSRQVLKQQLKPLLLLLLLLFVMCFAWTSDARFVRGWPATQTQRTSLIIGHFNGLCLLLVGSLACARLVCPSVGTSRRPPLWALVC